MAVVSSFIKVGVAMVFVVVTAIGCADLPDARDQPRHDCNFGNLYSSQNECSLEGVQQQCTSTEWRSDDHVCTGRECAPTRVENPEHDDAYFTYCGHGSVINSKAGTALSAWTSEILADRSARTTPDPAQTSVGAPQPLPTSEALTKATAVTIDEFALPAAGMQPGPIVVAGGRVLFASVATCPSSTNCATSGVFSVDSAGKVALVEGFCNTAGAACRVTGLTALPDGGYCYNAIRLVINSRQKPDIVWCTGPSYRIQHPVRPLNGFLSGVGFGYDGKVWYLDGQFGGIGRLTANNAAAIQAVYLSNGTDNLGLATIVAGPDQAMWFTATYGNQIGRINGSGYKLYTLPTSDSRPVAIALGPDGNLWFTEFKGNRIGRITPAGLVTEFPLPTASAGPMGITAGPDGTMWFTEFKANKVGRIAMSGAIEEYAIPTSASQPSGIVTGPDKNVWFTEFQGNKIGRIVPPPVSALPQVVEFYNVNLDTYFITAAGAEQSAIDNGSAGPGWSRTGATFPSGGSTQVCRFYGSLSPGPNSHFYTADPNECAQLKQIQATTPATQKRWNFESNDFQTTPATNGTCPANLLPVYRAYNNGFTRGVDSNHRITPSQAAISEVVARGWSSEGVVMCAPK